VLAAADLPTLERWLVLATTAASSTAFEAGMNETGRQE
jgi:hypothetical protein